MKRIGWIGYAEDKPFFELTTDEYVGSNESPIFAVDVYKQKKEARRRFEDVREVFVADADDRLKKNFAKKQALKK